MRRMRGFFNGWVVTLIFTATLGYFAVRHWPSPKSSTEIKPETPVATTPSESEAKTEAKATKHKPAKVDREIASTHDRDEPVLERTQIRPSKKTRGTAPSFCESLEYRGSGPQSGPNGQWGRITTEQWSKVMKEFHGAKKDILSWLDEHRALFAREVAEHMEAEVKELRLQRPPTPDFPDLAFRGIGLWTRPVGERPIIKLGGGFAKLVERHPQRARFELTRLLAQTWSPCELSRSPVATHIPADGAWGSVLSCLSVKDENACQPGSFSEAGWAISSAIASVASPPGCTVPAFASGVGDSCLKDIRSTGSRLPAGNLRSAAVDAPRSARGLNPPVEGSRSNDRIKEAKK